jgi:hypothetical protein
VAILLVRALDKTDPDPVKNKGLGKRGDIIEVFDDSVKCVIPPAPDYIILKVSGITKEQAQKYMQTQIVDGVIERKRLYKMLVDSAALPGSIKTELQNKRYVEIAWNIAHNFIQNKATLGTE